MTPEEFLKFSEGPCEICGESPGKAYTFPGANVPTMRVCHRHAFMFRAYNTWEMLLIARQIQLQFPFWSRFLRENNSKLFAYGHEPVGDGIT